MKVTSAKVEYRNNGFPWKWELTISDPKITLEELRFEKKENCYFAEKDGYVSFFAWSGKPDRGFGGTCFPITMKDGSSVVLQGPWSSNSAAMDKMGFTPSFACVFEGRLAAHITVEEAKRILKEFNLPYKIFQLLYGPNRTHDGYYLYPSDFHEGKNVSHDHWLGREA